MNEPQFAVEPWTIRETDLHFDRLAQSESVFALANGHIGVRGNFEEGDPVALPGTYLNSFYEKRPLPYAEAGYGYPEVGQGIINVTNGKLIRMLVDDQTFDLRYGWVHKFERTLDMRTGLLHREVIWETPAHKKVRITSTRLVSFTQRAILAIDLAVEALDPVNLVLQSELVANEEMPQQSKDPRVEEAFREPLVPERNSANDLRSMLIHQTEHSGLRMGVACDHVAEGVGGGHTYTEPDWARTTFGAQLKAGEQVHLQKFVAYGWSSQRSLSSVRDQVDGSLSTALHTGWDGLVQEQREYLDDFWDGADVEIEGDPALQQAVRFGLWHTLQAGARAEGRAIPAKGLTGSGYDGHSFWDTETFVLPVLSATAPHAAADALAWRHSTLGIAKEHARSLKHKGAMFPWRTIRGHECSGYWPAGTAALHINADIAVAAARHVFWTGDDTFEQDIALPLLVETARLWIDVGYHGDDGEFHIDGVTGPDEYSAIVRDNTFTNLMAARNLRYAADVCEKWPDAATELDVTPDEIAAWRAADEAMSVPFDAERDVHQQDRGSTDREVWDFEETASSDSYPLLLNYPYFDIYRKQVVKQADLVLAMHWCGDDFTAEQKAKAFAYYEPITVRDSSLSACTQAIVAAEVGHRKLANAYLHQAALMDLRDLEKNTKNGVHVASLAGAWLAVVCGFGGMRDHGGELTFAPALPDHLTRLTFTVRWRGVKVRVRVTQDDATYRIENGPDSSLELAHYGEKFTVRSGESVSKPITPVQPSTPAPTQPAGRSPRTDLD